MKSHFPPKNKQIPVPILPLQDPLEIFELSGKPSLLRRHLTEESGGGKKFGEMPAVNQ
jgi:hypothetical protein